MKRRDFLRLAAAVPLAGSLGGVAFAAPAGGSRRLLILVELKGGNDGLNTVIPYADPQYARLRPRIAIDRDRVLKLDDQLGLHPSLEKLMPLWSARELAIVQGVGYPDPNLSHFRSIEIWDTASKSEEYLEDGWLARAFAASPSPAAYAADGVVVGAADMGPLQGGTRAIALTSPEQFLRNARLARDAGVARNPALAHILRVEREIIASAEKLNAGHVFQTDFPQGAFGNAVKTAAQLAANPAGIAVIRVTLGGFDTHANQQGVHANLLRQLGEGLAALREALIEIDRWKTTTIATYSEFGRRPKENQSGGTDHGTANVHLVMGGAVKGGLHGAAPNLERIDGNGNLAHAVDFRGYYATLLERWWGIDSRGPLKGRFATLDVLNA
ncbi:DUF1501 domain-containing protein [Usitatibacter palustris]|uniref:Twin-arginine translocation pathway signal sequence domain-containing protein n=1 Tax=Usitatibacter palustris TaxID=2732487 RepID=A0A6M4H672_9PROT|nr:DUF1501 domain-containing protein [Usitatibacter palustris]QJR15000.1 hypothetical protein DSM104440_01815 [Usitatibacter palustris]